MREWGEGGSEGVREGGREGVKEGGSEGVREKVSEEGRKFGKVQVDSQKFMSVSAMLFKPKQNLQLGWGEIQPLKTPH